MIVLTPNNVNIQNSSKQSTTLLGRNIEFNGANFTELNETVSELGIIWSCPGNVNLPWGRCCNWIKKQLIFLFFIKKVFDLLSNVSEDYLVVIYFSYYPDPK